MSRSTLNADTESVQKIFLLMFTWWINRLLVTPMIGGDAPYRILADQELNLHVYYSLVQYYPRRYLTFPEDIVNAFDGIARMLFGSSLIVYGIPLCVLDLALCCTLPDHSNGRINFLVGPGSAGLEKCITSPCGTCLSGRSHASS